ncbi:MAG: TIM44-like domain-containing protein [Planctomycetota bacterium]
MNNKLFLPTILISLLALSSPAFARGGGGCLEEGTRVLTPRGETPVESLSPGDAVWAVVGDRRIPATVVARPSVTPDTYLEITLPGKILRVTPEHPIETAPGVFRQASFLRAGDDIRRWDGTASRSVSILALRRVAAARPAYNLLISPGGTFIAAGVVVHNKGCFLPDTPILRADGAPVPIREVRPGDALLAFAPGGTPVRTIVKSVITRVTEEYLLVTAGDRILHVTADHPFYVGAGTFRTMEALSPGDTIYIYDGTGLAPRLITGLARVPGPVMVYNLQTDAPHTFFASGIAVHNKGGGCFPAGTRVASPTGDVAIEHLRPGDIVVSGDGAPAAVEAIHTARSPLIRIETDAGTLFTTADHPLAVPGGGFRPAATLAVGDFLLAGPAAGRRQARILTISPAELDAPVFNLAVAAPHTFLANGFVVHNKGGGSHGGGFHSRSGRSSGGFSRGDNVDQTTLICSLIFIGGVIILIVLINQKMARKNLDFVFKPSQVAPKREKTRKLLEFIARTDGDFAPAAIENAARATFLKLQECWQARDYTPMKLLLFPNLFARHEAQIRGMIRNHEINVIGNLAVENVEIVNVRYTHLSDQREFTALITARAQDHYIDDRTREFIRGDESSARFQEFWTFQRRGNAWLLRDIEQTGESDVLKDENFFEAMTEDAREKIYGDAAGRAGPAGPWLDKSVGTKERRTERLLAFLAQTDKLWNRNAMTERARTVFTGVYLAREAGNPEGVPAADLFPDVAASLADSLRCRREEGFATEYRNFCVRKVDIVLVRNFADNSKDEFTVRVTAHAQSIVRKGDRVVREDADVTAFEEYWTFGRFENAWRLKGAQPPARGRAMTAAENLDEDSSPEQVKWYYEKDRAN